MVFRFRLEADDDSGHFRQGAIEAESKEEAQRALMRREYAMAAYQLDDDKLAEVKANPGSAQSRSRVAVHNQEKPYKLIWVREA